ncbi:Uma2 family endonuclease [Nocardioides albidus]|uniref:Uma2 family endonuclease n=1 Tax=Nocardioides albidus TaxID=1517589 RepID=A0A5C4VKW6_9ACTN|nr:Uma2 family endonuclease [Nocardioides albidus]TNM36401.1 Uma2 family endonuclease [Nocardioides albidus]
MLRLLFASQPSHLEVLAEPFDVLSVDTAVQPDVVVFDPTALVGEEPIAVLPTLVIEILSPSTALYDLNTKFKRYERAGIPAYWVVDPRAVRTRRSRRRALTPALRQWRP